MVEVHLSCMPCTSQHGYIKYGHTQSEFRKLFFPSPRTVSSLSDHFVQSNEAIRPACVSWQHGAIYPNREWFTGRGCLPLSGWHITGNGWQRLLADGWMGCRLTDVIDKIRCILKIRSARYFFTLPHLEPTTCSPSPPVSSSSSAQP